MHVPDGLLSAPIALSSAAFAAACVGAAAARARGPRSSRAGATLGVTAAFVFAAQMLNFPVAGGTSGHLIGGVLAAVLVGPSAAVIVMTAVLVLQCLVFGDGGLLALGANILNMAVIHPLVGYAAYRLALGKSAPRRIAAIALGSWVATIVSAATCAGELALSGVAAPAVVLPAMVGTHLFVGVGEAVISALVLASVLRVRPDLLEARPIPARPLPTVVLGLGVSLALALFVSPFACSWPDGLEHVVERLGIEPSHALVTVPAPLRDYAMPGLEGALKTSAAAFVGTLLVFGLCLGLGFALAPRGKREMAS